jgi:riboflavin kinase
MTASISVQGTVESGLGRGQEFVALEGYAEQFERKLGYEPYPGTLNLDLEAPVRERFGDLEPIRIEGWEAGSDSFGAVDCYPASPVDGDVPLHVIVPDRTDHDLSTLELISPVQLRERFGLEDGSTFEIRIESAADRPGAAADSDG